MIYLVYFQQNANTKIQRFSLLHRQYITQNDIYYKINDVTNVPVYSRLKHDYIKKNPVSYFESAT